jgi:hypothetical protein
MTERSYPIDDFTMKESWRLFRIMAEFVDGFETMAVFLRKMDFT